MVPKLPLSRPLVLLASVVVLGALTACPKPHPTNALVNTQAAARLPVEEQLQMPVLGQDLEAEPGIAEVTLVRTPADLGRFSGSLPAEVSLEKSMLVYIGRDRSYRAQRDQAQKLVLIDAPARDIYSPGVTVNSSEMHTVVSLLFDRPAQCGGKTLPGTTVTPSEGGAPVEEPKADAETPGAGGTLGVPVPGDGKADEGKPNLPAKGDKRNPRDAQLLQGVAEGAEATSEGGETVSSGPVLRLFVVPALPDPVQVSIESLPCPEA